MPDEQDNAENLDEDALGDDANEDRLPGLDQQGETGPMSSEDPTFVTGGAEAEDDEPTRAWRSEPESGSDAGSERATMSLLEADEAGLDQLDDEAEMIGEDAATSDSEIGPEDRALHVES